MMDLRARYYVEIFEGRVLQNRVEDDNDKLVMSRDKLAQAEKFISVMVDINAVSIKDMGNNCGLQWARVMPVIVKLWTLDHSSDQSILTKRLRETFEI